MEDQLKFFPLPSLKDMALRTAAVLLWSDSDLFSPGSMIDRAVPFYPHQEKITAKVSQLELPKSLTKQMVDVVGLVGLEIRKWRQFLQEHLFKRYRDARRNCSPIALIRGFGADRLSDSSRLCWTTAGRIDHRKTVKGLHCNALGVKKLYEIACDFCLEDRIALLWEQLPEKAKEYYSDEKYIFSCLSFQWPHILKGKQSKLNEWLNECLDESYMNFNQYSFETAAEMGKKSAAEYFYQKLTPEEREASVMRSFSTVVKSIHLEDDFKDSIGETFFYLLTLMTPEQQMEKLKAHPIHLFFCFFDMVWPDLFLENAPLIWKHLPPKDYALLQQVLVEKIEWESEYSPELLMQLFTRSPPDFMKCFLGQQSESKKSPACSFLSACFAHEYSESVQALFRSLDAADRVKLVFHCSVIQFFVRRMIHFGQWAMVELCLGEAMLSTGDRGRLKKHFVRALEREDPESVSQQKLKRFYDFLDAPDASSDKEKKGQKRKIENQDA